MAARFNVPGKRRRVETVPHRSMFTHLTGQARRVLRLAHQEAFQRNHDYVGSEHLLLAMLREGGGEAARLLAGCGVDPDQVAAALDTELRPAIRLLELERLPLTLAVQRVLDNAFAEAERVGQAEAGVAHLLLGILAEYDSQAAQILERAGLSYDRCRQQVEGGGVAENRDRLVQTAAPAIPGSTRDPSAQELEARISVDVLPREWRPRPGATPVQERAVEAQLRGTQVVLGGILGALALYEMYGWIGVPLGILLGIMVAAFQNSVLGCLFAGTAGFFIGLQYIRDGIWIIFTTTLVGVFLGSWLGHAWRPVHPAAPPRDGEDE